MALSFGPYTLFSRTDEYFEGSEAENGVYQHDIDRSRHVMVGGTVGTAVGAWFGEHVAVGGFLRVGFPSLAEAAEPSTTIVVETGPSLLIAQQRHRGLRLAISPGIGLLRGLGLACGIDIGYALPIPRGAVALGVGADVIVSRSSEAGDSSDYKFRDVLLMPNLSVRYVH